MTPNFNLDLKKHEKDSYYMKQIIERATEPRIPSLKIPSEILNDLFHPPATISRSTEFSDDFKTMCNRPLPNFTAINILNINNTNN